MVKAVAALGLGSEGDGSAVHDSGAGGAGLDAAAALGGSDHGGGAVRAGRRGPGGHCHGDGSGDAGVVHGDLVVLGVGGHSRPISVDHQGQGVTGLHLVNGGLEVEGVVLVGLAVQSHAGIGGVGVKARAGVAEIHPAAGDDLIGDVAGQEEGLVEVLQAAAHPGAVLQGRGLGDVAAGGVEGGEGLTLGGDVHQHGADHQAVPPTDGGPTLAQVLGQGGEVHSHGALDGGALRHGLGVHHAVGGGPGGELVLPVVAGDAVRVVVAVDGGGAGLGGIEGQLVIRLPGGVSIPGVGVVAVLRGDSGHILGTVVHAVEVVAEPAVQDLVVAGIADVKDVAAGFSGPRTLPCPAPMLRKKAADQRSAAFFVLIPSFSPGSAAPRGGDAQRSAPAPAHFPPAPWHGTALHAPGASPVSGWP